MRGLTVTLDSPHPLGDALPGVYQESEFALSLCEGLDAVLAPVFSVLDNLEAYFDPHLAPDDFVIWLAEWVGLLVDETWPMELTRELVSTTVDLYKWHGTNVGLSRLVELYTGSVPEITESGGVVWSAVPGVDLPGSSPPSVQIRVAVDDPGAVDDRRLEAVVAASMPAHVPYTIEVVGATPVTGPDAS